jgi:hypothetical protein
MWWGRGDRYKLMFFWFSWCLGAQDIDQFWMGFKHLPIATTTTTTRECAIKVVSNVHPDVTKKETWKSLVAKGWNGGSSQMQG